MAYLTKDIRQNDSKERDLDSEVKKANKEFYNIASDMYEKVDGRRTKYLDLWLEASLKKLSDATEGKILLDAGCGAGAVLRNSSRLFTYSYGIDIAEEILKKNDKRNVVCADCSYIPFKTGSVDVVVCFSTLHHMYDHKGFLKEAYRVLKNNGLLYTDHDIETTFVKRFYLLVKIYRSIFNPADRYMKYKNALTRELYNLSEIHSDGIDSDNISEQLQYIGFRDIHIRYHWFGLHTLTNGIFADRACKKGFAPIVSIVARK